MTGNHTAAPAAPAAGRSAAGAAPLPTVSVVVPCRNDRAYIARCLDSILANDYPPHLVELIVVDGMSDDGTREIVDDYAASCQRVTRLDNPQRITPTALNAGVRAARGDVVIRMDTHSLYPSSYISALVGWLLRSGADNVGGVCRTVAANEGAQARAIAVALSHPFGVGNALFRTGVSEPRWVDTVPFGCYRRDVFTRIGLFDEALVRNQDDEFNHRLITHGGRILLVPDVVSVYYARATVPQLARMYYQYGYFKPLVAAKLRRVLTLRQLVPPVLVGTLAMTLALAPLGGIFSFGAAAVWCAYLAVIGACAAKAGGRMGAAVVLWLLAAFPAMHLSYGVGVYRGIVDFVIRRRTHARDAAAIPLSR